MSKLLTRVKSHVRGQATSGQNTLALLYECITHMRDNGNEWSALAYLIGQSQPAQSRIARKITGQILQGWSMAKDEDQPSGLRFRKVKGKNQGFDEDMLVKLSEFVDTKHSVQSKAVVDFFTPEKASPTDWTEEDAIKAVKRHLKQMDERHFPPAQYIALMQGVLAEQAGDVDF